MKLRDLFKRVPPSPEALEQQNKEKQAYKEELYKARIQAARKRGTQAGRTQQGSHGIMATLRTIDRTMTRASDYGLQMQKNLEGMFDTNPFNINPKQKKRKQK